MSKTLKIIYSTLAVVMVVNSVIFALPIVGQAQAIEKQAVAEAEFTATQKTELEKAQKEAKLAMYKEFGLSSAEQKFVEKYADKMDIFNQILDNGTSNDRNRYVAYNMKNGNATLNVTNIYNDIRTLQKATILSRSQVLTLKDIALKLVRNYNKTVNSIKSETIPAQKINSKSGITQDTPEVKVSKTIIDRGFEVKSEVSPVEYKSSIQSRAFLGCSSFAYWSNIAFQWWGFSTSIAFTDCGIKWVQWSADGITGISGGLALACTAGVITASICGWPLGGISVGVWAIKWMIEGSNNACGNRGLIFKYKKSYFWSVPGFLYWQCV